MKKKPVFFPNALYECPDECIDVELVYVTYPYFNSHEIYLNALVDDSENIYVALTACDMFSAERIGFTNYLLKTDAFKEICGESPVRVQKGRVHMKSGNIRYADMIDIPTFKFVLQYHAAMCPGEIEDRLLQVIDTNPSITLI